jgi:hypothetical protein
MNEKASVGIGDFVKIEASDVAGFYIVKTQSIFENVYLIRAFDPKSAVEFVLDSDSSPDFVQKHLGEKAFSVEKSVGMTANEMKQKFPGFN